jgi:hypothetical protein
MEKPIKESIKNLKQSVKNLKQEVEARVAADGDSLATNINFKGRTNIQVSKNIGQPGGTAYSSSTQNAPIDQNSSH